MVVVIVNIRMANFLVSKEAASIKPVVFVYPLAHHPWHEYSRRNMTIITFILNKLSTMFIVLSTPPPAEQKCHYPPGTLHASHFLKCAISRP